MQRRGQTPEQNAREYLEAFATASSQECLRRLGSGPDGLTSEEAARRLRTIGTNTTPSEERSAPVILREQFENGITLLLVGAGIITLVLRDLVDGLIILALLLVNTSLGFLQEYRAERALAHLRGIMEIRVRAVRDGQETGIPSRELVPGDIVLVRAGDLVPADLRLIEGEGLMVSQAVLTGESLWQEKDATPLAAPPERLSDAKNTLFSGTSMMAGAGKGVVVATGSRTAFGQTASLLQNVRAPGDFQRNLTRFAGFLLGFALFLTALIFVANALLGRGLLLSLTLALTLALGMAPEALPAVTITALSLGAAALARKKVVVRRLSALEEFSTVDVLCTDKTGTITQNRIVVTGLQTETAEKELLQAAALCSTLPGGENPVDQAVIQAARARGWDLSHLAGIRRLGTIPFTSDRKRVSVGIAPSTQGTAECELITKGAASVVLKLCSRVKRAGQLVDIAPELRALDEQVRAGARAGNSVLAVAVRPLSSCRAPSETDERDLILLGFILLADPVRPGAQEALRRARALGLDVKIVTGDAADTAAALARAVRLPAGPQEIVAGPDLRDPRQVFRLVERAHVFAETVPEDKYHLVRALQLRGHRVAVTGDGINDAPALKAADVGIAMQSGSEVAKDASDLILLENDLSVIVDGLRQGRRTFVNLHRYLLYTMVGNFANVLIVAVASLLLDFLPLLPTQVLLLNILSDLAMLSIATDRVSAGQVARPRHWHIRQVVEPAIYLGILNALFALGLLRFFRAAGPEELRTAWYLFLAISTVLVLFPVRSHGLFWSDVPPSFPVLATTAGCLVVGVLLAQLPVSQALFGFVPLPALALPAISGYSLLYLLLAEALLLAYYRHTGST